MINCRWQEVEEGSVPSLQPSHIHLWRLDLESTAERILYLREDLTAEEIQRADRFIRPEHQARFALVRGTLRHLLGLYTGGAPEALNLGENEFGKPALSDFPSVQFNVSHTEGVALIGVNIDQPIGVDVEYRKSRVAWKKIVQRFFTPDEIEQLFALEARAGLDGFYRLWTLKEAYMKARGHGLSWGLDKFSMRGADGGDCGVDWDKNDVSAPDDWLVDLVDVGGEAAGALATPYPDPVVKSFRCS